MQGVQRGRDMPARTAEENMKATTVPTKAAANNGSKKAEHHCRNSRPEQHGQCWLLCRMVRAWVGTVIEMRQAAEQHAQLCCPVCLAPRSEVGLGVCLKVCLAQCLMTCFTGCSNSISDTTLIQGAGQYGPQCLEQRILSSALAVG